MLDIVQSSRSTRRRDEMRSRVLNLFPPVDDPQTAWMERAVCPQTDPETFYPEKGYSTRDGKAVCNSCPVRLQCLAYALSNDEEFGIWGGLTRPERKAFKATGRPVEEADAYFTGALRESGARHAS